MFEVNETVIIKEFKGDEYNEEARVKAIYEDGRVWVSNLNMPFMGTVSAIYEPDELEKRK